MAEYDLLRQGIEYGFINSTALAEERYKPALLVNDYEQGEKVLTTLISELKSCDEFFFSVAFITEGGVTVLLEALRSISERKNSENKPIRGKIIASQYQDFTQPKALKRLLQFKNIELRIVTDDKCMHTKGYIFRHGQEYTSIIGSSNLTQAALCENKEWNMKVVSAMDGGITKDALKEFNKLFEMATPVDDEFLEIYSKIYFEKQYWNRKSYEEYKENIIEFRDNINPNTMQEAALANLMQLRNDGARSALVISATGTGKTYLAAFDVRNANPKRFLFLVHREEIAKSAMNSFRRVIGSGKSMALMSGTNKNYDADYLFAMIPTMAKESTLNKFEPDAFDYIVIDEAHRSGAKTYQDILSYFKPKFLLGMTATPERTDGYDIFELFDHNIAYEIRLQDAMKEHLICPFHYFGISDLTVDGVPFDDKTKFNDLTSDARVDHILEQSEFYGYSGDRVKGLIFCSENKICAELSRKFNLKGYKTIDLSGETSQEKREEAIRLLENGEGEDRLDYIFTVDIFNEGVDIPAINQVIMLRPTASAIIFVQQLGRGLRNHIDKDYLVVLDFIGNYQKSFLIPIALSGDKTYNKDTIRKYTLSGSSVIPGCSTICFDEISEKHIFDSINKNMKIYAKEYKEKFNYLKNKLGRIPFLCDFEYENSIDPRIIVDYKGSYYNFLVDVAKEDSFLLNDNEKDMLEYISKFMVYSKRPYECLILRELLGKDETSYNEILEISEKEYGFNNLASIEHAATCLQGLFELSKTISKYRDCKLVEINNGLISKTKVFENLLMNDVFKVFVEDIVECYLMICKTRYSEHDSFELTYYEKYSRKDFCRIYNWPKNEEATIFGYRVKNGHCPIFVTYNKNEETTTKSTLYPDEFVTKSIFSWMTRNNCTLESDEVKEIFKAEETGLVIPLFIKKSDAEGSDFYYIGQVKPINDLTLQTKIKNDKGKELPIVNFKFQIDKSVREDLYEYLIK